jgi:choline-sulfatase
MWVYLHFVSVAVRSLQMLGGRRSWCRQPGGRSSGIGFGAEAAVHKAMRGLSRWRRWALIAGCSIVLSVSVRASARHADASVSVILISVDTLRADHLSCYGYRRFLTPSIDSLQHHGTLFTEIDSQVPLTLPSHTSLLTSTYPFTNGVEENEDTLGPALPTLATILKSRGYHTAAFIGGYVLARRFGLSRGFDVYDAPFDNSTSVFALKRPAERVILSAAAWLRHHSGGPFFVFIHLFDLHQPYELPASAEKTYGGDKYDAELGYVDASLGALWKFLAKERLWTNTLVIFTADHGESLGEHGESTHGYFVYQSTLHVPLIVRWPDGTKLRYPNKVETPAGLIAVAPTVLQFLGIPAPASFQGQSLLGLLTGQELGPQREIYSESLYAHDRLGFAALQSLRIGDRQYIDAPRPELYDLGRDPKELHNVAPREQAMAQSFREKLVELRSRFGSAKPATTASVSPEVLANLRSLGYLSTSIPTQNLDESEPDPKDRLDEYREYVHGIRLLAAREIPAAEAVFRQILSQDRASLAGHYYLAVCYADADRLHHAIRQLRSALAISPRDAQAAELMGSIWIRVGQYERARDGFKYLLTFASQDYAADFGLGVVAAHQQRLGAAIHHFDSALEVRPRSARAHFALGQIYFERRNFNLAQNQFTDVTRLRPRFADAYYDLGLALQKEGRDHRAVRAFQRALNCDPRFLAARNKIESLSRLKK